MMICNVHDRERRDEESSVQLKTSDTIQHEKRSHENQARATLHATHTSACLFRTQTRTRTLGHMLHKTCPLPSSSPARPNHGWSVLQVVRPLLNKWLAALCVMAGLVMIASTTVVLAAMVVRGRASEQDVAVAVAGLGVHERRLRPDLPLFVAPLAYPWPP